MNEIVMFTNLAKEEESFVKVLSSLRRLLRFCELNIASVVSLPSK